MIFVVAFNPKRTLLVGKVGPSAEELQKMIVSVVRVASWIVDAIICPKMLSEMIFAGKCISS